MLAKVLGLGFLGCLRFLGFRVLRPLHIFLSGPNAGADALAPFVHSHASLALAVALALEGLHHPNLKDDMNPKRVPYGSSNC